MELILSMHRPARAVLVAIAVAATLLMSMLISVQPAHAGNERNSASLNILKTDGEGAPLAGAVFEVEGLEGTFTTGADGKACILDLPADTDYLITEIQAPPGYQLANPASQVAETDEDGDCDSPDAVFVNLPEEEEETIPPSAPPTGGTLPNQSQPTPPVVRESTAASQARPAARVLPNTAVADELALTPVTGGLTALILASALGVVVARRRAGESRR